MILTWGEINGPVDGFSCCIISRTCCVSSLTSFWRSGEWRRIAPPRPAPPHLESIPISFTSGGHRTLCILRNSNFILDAQKRRPNGLAVKRLLKVNSDLTLTRKNQLQVAECFLVGPMRVVDQFLPIESNDILLFWDLAFVLESVFFRNR